MQLSQFKMNNVAWQLGIEICFLQYVWWNATYSVIIFAQFAVFNTWKKIDEIWRSLEVLVSVVFILPMRTD